MQQILRNVLFLCRRALTKTHLLTLTYLDEAFLRQKAHHKVSACTQKRKKGVVWRKKETARSAVWRGQRYWSYHSAAPSDAVTSGHTRPATRAWRNRERPGSVWCCQPDLAKCYAARLARMVLITAW